MGKKNPDLLLGPVRLSGTLLESNPIMVGPSGPTVSVFTVLEVRTTEVHCFTDRNVIATSAFVSGGGVCVGYCPWAVDYFKFFFVHVTKLPFTPRPVNKIFKLFHS